MKRNIILIGMPGAGKSTVGVVLAKHLGYRFLDSDLVIQETHGKLLHRLIEEYGVEGFWKLENDANLSIQTNQTVIATGGSAIYGQEAMEKFRREGIVCYLKLSYQEIEKRLGDLNRRGVTLKEGQDLKALFLERIPYYEKYAHIIIDCESKPIREIVHEINEKIKKVN